jgi:hypothetical protein
VLLLSEGDTLASGKPESFWDLHDLAFPTDPYPIYARLRNEMPPYRNEKDAEGPELGKLWLLIG